MSILEENQKSRDHDLLVRLDQKVDSLTTTVEDLKDGTINRLSVLENEKADRAEVQEIQQKINNLQKHINENVEARISKQERLTDKYFITMALYTIATASMMGLIIYHIAKH